MAPKVKSTVVKTQKISSKRRRTKKLHKELLAQLEFYLSEANLRHDPFMREKVGEGGTNDIGIQVFLSSPLIQEMKVTEMDVITVVKISQVLQLSEDKKSIHRRFPVPGPPEDLEESTLYIENLPQDSTAEWLKDFCRKIGEVRYISLPRYKKSDQIKGFAFVEFSAPHEVDRARRILRDSSQSFFPKRTERFLNRLKRLKLIKENAEHACSIVSSKPVSSSDVTLNTPESCLLNKSFDSAIDFELIGQEDETETPLARDRKRQRSPGVGETSNCQKIDKVTPSRIPAKKMKSLSMLLDDKSREMNKCAARRSVSMTTEKKSGQKVAFSTHKEDDMSKLSKPDKNGQTFSNSNEIYKNVSSSNDKSSYCDISKISPDVKIAIHGKETYNMRGLETGKHSMDIKKSVRISTVEGQQSNVRLSDVEARSRFAIKRRRSASEPSEICAREEKRLKAESPDASDVVCEPLLSEIDKMISQGRLQAKAADVAEPPTCTFKRTLQSVIAKPTIAQEVPKNSRRRRRRCRRAQNRKRAGYEPVELTVMSKVDWSKLKSEYKAEQRRNMGILKKTLKENKEAGSVFIQKHLDVLHDVNVSNESIEVGEEEESVNRNNGIVKEHKLLKRGPLTFQPGVIVKISATEGEPAPGGDLRPHQLPSIEEIKSTLNNYGQGVAYVDVQRGRSEGFVRFNDGESAQRAIMEEKSLALCLLTGQHEEQYWDKLLASKEQKYARERPKIRGRTKILNRVEALVEKAKRRHIRFDNDLAV